MPLSAAERQRRYKEKMKRDPEKYDDYKRKKRNNYHVKKRLVKDLTPKERHNARIIWKLRKKNSRKNRRQLNRLLDITPPSSPSILVPEANPTQDVFLNSPQQNSMSGFSAPQSSDVAGKNVSEKNKGRTKVRRDRSKLYRENLRLQQEIANLKKRYEKYKKRFSRNKKKQEKTNKNKESLMKQLNTKKLSNAIKEKYQTTKKHKDKNMLKTIFENFHFKVS